MRRIQARVAIRVEILNSLLPISKRRNMYTLTLPFIAMLVEVRNTPRNLRKTRGLLHDLMINWRDIVANYWSCRCSLLRLCRLDMSWRSDQATSLSGLTPA